MINIILSTEFINQPLLPSQGHVLVVTGESGTGKSWIVNALAELATRDVAIPVLLESRGSAEQDLQKVAERFWYEIHDGEDCLHISRIAKRLRRVLGDKADVGRHLL